MTHTFNLCTPAQAGQVRHRLSLASFSPCYVCSRETTVNFGKQEVTQATISSSAYQCLLCSADKDQKQSLHVFL